MVLARIIFGVLAAPFTNGWSLLAGIILAGFSALPGNLSKKFGPTRSPRP